MALKKLINLFILTPLLDCSERTEIIQLLIQDILYEERTLGVKYTYSQSIVVIYLLGFLLPSHYYLVY
jgi:Fe2+ transport system protein B